MEYKNETIEDREEILDGNSYEKCTFRRCMLYYNGGQLPRMIECFFLDNTQWSLGNAAERTLRFIRLMWEQDNELSRMFVGRTFEIITGTKLYDSDGNIIE